MIRVHDFTKCFNKDVLINKVSCDVSSGEIFGLIGASGAGKSTFLRTLAGVCIPSGGSVEINDVAILESADVKQKIFFVPEKVFFCRDFTVFDMKRFYSKVYRNWDNDLFENLCVSFLVDQKQKFCEMSDSVQKLVYIIFGMASGANFLIIDDVFNDTDTSINRKLKMLFKEQVNEKGSTIILSSQNLIDVNEVCNRVGILSSGQLFIKDVPFNLEEISAFMEVTAK